MFNLHHMYQWAAPRKLKNLYCDIDFKNVYEELIDHHQHQDLSHPAVWWSSWRVVIAFKRLSILWDCDDYLHHQLSYFGERDENGSTHLVKQLTRPASVRDVAKNSRTIENLQDEKVNRKKFYVFVEIFIPYLHNIHVAFNG